MKEISTAIRQRRAYFSKAYTQKEIPVEIIEEILENANWAPTHKRTEPWRYRIFHSLEARQRLADFIASDYKKHAPAEMFSEIKQLEISEKPILSGCTIAICLHRDAAESLPEWEEVAAVAMSVQNMWLTCSAFGIGSYWASPGFIARLGPVLELSEGEKCIGLFYMGYLKENAVAPAIRSNMKEKIKWM